MGSTIAKWNRLGGKFKFRRLDWESEIGELDDDGDEGHEGDGDATDGGQVLLAD